MKSIVSSALTLILITGLPACNGFNPSPCKGIDPYFNINGISGVTVFDKSPSSTPVSVTDSVAFENHFFEAAFAVSFFSDLQLQPHKNVGFMNVAYALDCATPGSSGTKDEGIDTLFITTANDLDNEFMAGDTINSIVSFATDRQTFLSSAEFVKANKEVLYRRSIQWKLTRMPTLLSVKYSFKIILKLSSGEVYTADSAPVLFFR